MIGNGGPGSAIGIREPNRLFRNEIGNKNNWIRLHLVGTVSNRDGIGSARAPFRGQVTALFDGPVRPAPAGADGSRFAPRRCGRSGQVVPVFAAENADCDRTVETLLRVVRSD